MTHNIKNIAGALTTLSEQIQTERSITTQDIDGLTLATCDAGEMMIRQLRIDGMSLTEATESIDKASVMHGTFGKEALDLAAEARRNVNVTLKDDEPAMTDTALSNVEASKGSASDIDADPNNDKSLQDNIGSIPNPAIAEAAKPRPTAATKTVSRNMTEANIAAPRQLIKYTVTMKPVSDIFKTIDPADLLFQFEVPTITWETPHPGIPERDPAYNMDPAQLLTMLYSIATQRSVNLVGPHGCGKTQFVEQVATRLGFPVTTLPMDGQLTRSQMIGQEKLRAGPHGTESYFSPGLLPLALEEPGFILFDEIDRGVSDLQYACHSVYLHQGLTVLEDGGRKIPFHQHNRVFATANTKGRGSMDGMYLAAEEMSEATRDRLSIWIEMDYQEVDEDVTVLKAKAPGLKVEHAKLIASMANLIRAAYVEGKLSQTCSMRQQLEVANMITFIGGKERDPDRLSKIVRMAFEMVVLGRASPQDKGSIQTMLQTKLPAAFTGADLI